MWGTCRPSGGRDNALGASRCDGPQCALHRLIDRSDSIKYAGAHDVGRSMKFLNIVIAASFVWLLVSFWNRNDLPGNIDLLPALADEPVQSSTTKKSFPAVYDNIEYLVQPEYDYDLTGMIVSYRHHDGNSRMHMQANDHLNMLDVCVVWGDNASNPLIHELDFWNGIFTCNVKTNSREAWELFDMFKLSNNHLISDDDVIRDEVKRIKIGDQIRVRGYLASYSNEGGGRRGTSTTRLDTGDGACETLFVERFDIMRPATSNWRRSMVASLSIFLLATMFHFKRPYRPYRGSAE